MAHELAELIATHRAAAELSQTELASRVGVSQQAFGNWERGDTLPRTEYLQKLAVHLTIPLERLILAKKADLEAAIRGGLTEGGLAADRLPAAEPAEEPSCSSKAAPAMSGFALLGLLTQALDKKQLKPHQIAALGALIQSFIHA